MSKVIKALQGRGSYLALREGIGGGSVGVNVHLRQCHAVCGGEPPGEIRFVCTCGAGAEVPGQALEEGVRQWARKAVVVETGAGDSVLIVHEDPVFLAQAARHIMDDVYQATGQPRLRIALHYGEVQLQPSSGAEPPAVVGGSAILCASRVEPHVLPGQIWATEEFRQVLVERPSLWRTTELTTPDGSDRFNVKKEGRSEPDLWVRLYRLEF